MTSKTLKSAIWLTMVASAVALAAGPPEGKGRKPPSEATNNLSVPAIMVAGVAGGLTNCAAAGWSALVPPTGIPLSGYPIDPLAEYFVQKVHKWQAQCITAQPGSVHVYAAWGDNLAGDAKLRAGSPIRVELLLTDTSGALAQGYEVVKLEPNKLDRESAYGTLATAGAATAVDMTPVVHDGLTRLQITGPDGWQAPVVNPLKPEINATGKVVYGYQLTAPAPGQYVITFTMPNVTIDACDVGTCADSTASLTITVGGGGGGKKGPQ